MSNKLQILLIVVLFALLIFLRGFFDTYMYDPLISYFKSDYLYIEFPEINNLKYTFSLFFRFSINTIISLIIIYLFYKNGNYVRFALKFYIAMFILLSVILILDLNYRFFNTYMVVFYARRFLIHPVFLIVLLPAFYYQKLQNISSKK
ncbi:exosortase F-associated protein [Lutibacter oricola]|uniref:Exosortase F-associated protein n=1 Tax=Lutibacter oricola TaxID=762486 RepID=A0A1H3BEW4_9FLAO|nr:exosortase F-associated protein [Lutibacter oricola]